MNAQEIIDRINPAKIQRCADGSFNIPCVAHEDRTPSLNIADGHSGPVVKCYAGCDQNAVINALKSLGAWPERKRDIKPERAKIAKVYDYLTEHGEILFQVCRMEPKSFRQRVPNPDGSYAWSVKGLRELIPYRLPELMATKNGICIVEGEKDADNLAALGVTATTFAAGAGKWRNEYARYFQGRRVYILPDNDTPGREHADMVATKLHGIAAEIKIISLPDLPDKGDASDWIKAGGTKQALAALITATPAWTPTAKPGPVQPEPEPQAVAVTADDVARVSGFIAFPDMGDKRIKATIPNAVALLNHYRVTVRYNVISKQNEIIIPGQSFGIDNAANCALSHLMSLSELHGMPTKRLPEYVEYIADRTQYNPVLDWIKSKPWDGIDRLHALTMSLDPGNPMLAQTFLTRWMIGAVHAISSPHGIENSAVLVLQGAQNAGKTSWFWSLTRAPGAPEDIAREGAIINPQDKDSVAGAIKYWLVEMGELDATFRKADIAAIKSFVTRGQDEYRAPYARCTSKYPRRTVFLATVNPKHYLHDETGNRRFWTVECGDKMNPHHGIDIQQVWAQAAVMLSEGWSWKLSPAELADLNASNDEFTAPDPIEELILKRFCMDIGIPRMNMMTATEVLLAIGYDRPSNKQSRDCASILRKVTQSSPKRTNKGWVFQMPDPRE